MLAAATNFFLATLGENCYSQSERETIEHPHAILAATNQDFPRERSRFLRRCRAQARAKLPYEN